MANLNAGDYIQATAKFFHPRLSAIQNVWHWFLDGTGTVDEGDVVVALLTQIPAIYEELESFLSDATEFVSLALDVVGWVGDSWDVLTHLGESNDPDPLWAASAAGNVLPPGVAALGTVNTLYPKHNGRKYFAPFTEDDNDADGDGTALLVNAVADALAVYDTALPMSATLDLAPAILNRAIGTYNSPVYVSAGPRFAYQRRRKLYRGI
jgi:hypothetical protein